ncbi:Phosphatidylinositol 4-phosphate 5-kinase 6 [Capsicum chinense]|nr:Phosphatidylinositol 4-phosphate 5-kinase 6 [Capsicum chinense]
MEMFTLSARVDITGIKSTTGKEEASPLPAKGKEQKGWYYSCNDGLYYKFESGTYVLIEFSKDGCGEMNSCQSISPIECSKDEVDVDINMLGENVSQVVEPLSTKFSEGINMVEKAELTKRRSDFKTQLKGEPKGQYYDVILSFGIIDILQNYDISKKLEHAYKAFHYDPTSIFTVDPKKYSKHF